MARGAIIFALLAAGAAYAVRKALNNVSRDISDWARIIEAEEAAALAEYQSPAVPTPLDGNCVASARCVGAGGTPFFAPFHEVSYDD